MLLLVWEGHRRGGRCRLVLLCPDYPIRSGAQTKSELLTTINPMVAQSFRSSGKGIGCGEGADFCRLWLMTRSPMFALISASHSERFHLRSR